jgi:hypothetical protein
MARTQKRDLTEPTLTEQSLEIYPGVRAIVSMRRATAQHRTPMFRWSEFFDELDHQPHDSVSRARAIGVPDMQSFRTMTGFDNVVRLPSVEGPFRHADYDDDDFEDEDDEDQGVAGALRGSTLLLGVAYLAATVMTGVAIAAAFFPPPADDWVHMVDVRTLSMPTDETSRRRADDTGAMPPADVSRIARFAVPSEFALSNPTTAAPREEVRATETAAAPAETAPLQNRSLDFSWLHGPSGEEPSTLAEMGTTTASTAPVDAAERAPARQTDILAAGIAVMAAPQTVYAPGLQIATFPILTPFTAGPGETRIGLAIR